MSEQPNGQQPNPLSRITAKGWTGIAVAVVVLVFILQNFQHVRVRLIFVDTIAPLWIVLLVTLLLGFLVGAFTTGRKRKD
ncbi:MULTISPECIES: lipopolysaccharide assembly protein LapA domain-containing protein [unclassified Glutamicibacter]|uniref:lipopolysaccharide assembly protein LapA domain-containing protein n=1 Tax=Glutamicibacter sp. PS TaxID=3075634 RepID=UPI00284808FC|nr:lipopolysaccharide assembly protein LapA domain-containing protein [Glutamicibacter sp. PS]MDR4534736.1 lipopolysaccharide assembly protein LapA domain-containing protein [Glutamicibacter sp. PS]